MSMVDYFLANVNRFGQGLTLSLSGGAQRRPLHAHAECVLSSPDCIPMVPQGPGVHLRALSWASASGEASGLTS
jgi:hypothetical protein